MQKDRLFFKKYLLWFLLSCGIAGLVYTISLIARFATSPNSMDFGEGFIMYVCQLWQAGQFQWDITQQPYMPMMYGVVFPTVAAPFVDLWGPDLRIGRGIEIVSTIIITVLVYLIARRFTKSRIIPLVAALLPFSYFGYQEWIFQSRVEMLGIMFEMVGLYLVVIWWHRGNRILSAIPFLLLAFFTKQSLITVAVAVGIVLLLVNRRLLVKYALILGGSLAGIILIATLATHGDYFRQLVFYNVTTPFFNHQGAMFNVWFMIVAPLAIQIVLAIAFFLKRIRSGDYNLIAIWVVTALVINGFTLLRTAAFVNYALEMIIAIGLATALYCDTRITQKGWLTFWMGCQILIVVAFYAVGLHFIPMPDRGYQARIDHVIEIIKDTQAPIYTEHAGLLMNQGKHPYWESFVYVNLIHKGYFTEQTVLADLDGQAIEYLVLQSPAEYPPRDDFGHMTFKMMDEISRNYSIVFNTYDQPGGGVGWYSFTVYKANKLMEYDEWQILSPAQ